ncbi:hypothetical protein B4U80_12938, partial [Leptotrombidium deliense]
MDRLKVILDGDDKNDNLTLPMIKAQNFYKSCIDTDNRDRYAIQGITTLLRQLSGCPLTDRFLLGDTLTSTYLDRNEKNEVELKFRQLAKKVLRFFGVSDNRELDRQLDEIIEFEISLAVASQNDDYRNKYIRVSARNMTQYLNFDLARIIQNVYSRLNYPYSSDTDDKIFIEDFTYLKKLGEILKNTKKR